MKNFLMATTAALAIISLAGNQAFAAGSTTDSTATVQAVPPDIAAMTATGSKHVVTRADDEDGSEGLEVEGHEGAEND